MSLALPFQTAKQLASAVRRRKIGCLELLDLYLARVEKHNPALNAIIAMDIEGARKRAKAADRTSVICMTVDAYEGWTTEGHTWWEVGTPAISENPDVTRTHEDWESSRHKQRQGI